MPLHGLLSDPRRCSLISNAMTHVEHPLWEMVRRSHDRRRRRAEAAFEVGAAGVEAWRGLENDGFSCWK